MTLPTGAVTVASVHEPVMGTFLQLQVTAPTEAEAVAAEQGVLAAVARAEAAFTRFAPDSDLVRWAEGRDEVPTPALARLLALAAAWHQRSAGALHPATAPLTERWLRAAAEGGAPTDEELDALAQSLRTLPYRVLDEAADPPAIDRVGDCRAVDVHALAKGHVLDLAAATVLAEHPVSRLVLNAGGDLLHRGTGVVRVGVEDPHAAYDNRPPERRVEVTDRAVATSGAARRWFDVGGVRRSRVLDPRTARPVDHAASATVVAPDAATADALATVASVLAPAEAVAFVAGLADHGIDAACLVIGEGGDEHRSPGWAELER